MKKVQLLIVVLIIFIAGLFSHLYHNFFLKKDIVGVYTNTNYDKGARVPDIPTYADTIILYPNNIFKSNFYGKGTFKIEVGITGTKISLKYKYEFGRAGFETSVIRDNWYKTKIE